MTKKDILTPTIAISLCEPLRDRHIIKLHRCNSLKFPSRLAEREIVASKRWLKNRYKKKMKSFNLLSNKFEINGNYLKMPLLKNIKLRKSRDIPDGFKIKQVQIIKKASGYYANVMIELDVDIPSISKLLLLTQKVIFCQALAQQIYIKLS